MRYNLHGKPSACGWSTRTETRAKSPRPRVLRRWSEGCALVAGRGCIITWLQTVLWAHGAVRSGRGLIWGRRSFKVFLLSVRGGVQGLGGCWGWRVGIRFHSGDGQRGGYSSHRGLDSCARVVKGIAHAYAAPLHDAGVLAACRHQVPVVVHEANVGHVTAVGTVLMTWGL